MSCRREGQSYTADTMKTIPRRGLNCKRAIYFSGAMRKIYAGRLNDFLGLEGKFSYIFCNLI
jgi:hypothetical protein